MRPIKLVVSAFGPYAGRVEICMDELGEKGLYLITGDTGAGKTTIFDAICFALFGEASGQNREVSMFRSKYAQASTPTEVELTFLHAGKEYYIKRNPEYMRPKKNGNGLMTSEKPNAELHLPNGDVVSKIKEVTAAVEEILGVNREQFSQIVMLAQGDFLKLLLAETKTRQEIFRKLFKTEYYQTLQFRLEEERKNVYGLCEDARKGLQQYVTGIACDEDNVLLLEVDKAKTGNMMSAEVVDLIDKLLLEDQEACDKQTEKLQTLNEALEVVNTNLGKAQELEKTKQELGLAKQELVSEQPKVEVLAEALSIAKEALKERDKLQEKIAAIEAELPDYALLDELVNAVQMAEKQLKNEEELLQINTKAEEDKAGLIATLKNELEALKNAGAEKEKLLARKVQSDSMLDSLNGITLEVQQLQKKYEELQQAQALYVQDDSSFKVKRNAYEQMEQAYRDGQAGVLAATLQDGQPCPVCGSIHHPHLASLAETVPTDAELECAKNAAEKARDKATDSSNKAGALKSTVETMEERLKKDAEKLLGTSELSTISEKLSSKIIETKQEIQEILEALSVEEQKLKRKTELEKKVPEEETTLFMFKETIGKLKESIAAAKTKLTSDNAQLKATASKLTFESSKAAIDKKTEFMLQKDVIQQAYDTAEQRHKNQEMTIATLKGKIESFEKTIENNEAVVDMEELEKEKQRLSLERSAVLIKQQEASTRLTTNKAVRANILKISEELAVFEEKLKWIATLAYTANGKLYGKSKVMLETYIQTTYFDRIINRANLRLFKMSGAQYELKRMAEADNNKSQSGLELGVIDHYNGTERSVKTLSGGESFMASLSLALGLSDEVQSCAGGIQIDTMFVDEGFGSLDADSLEQAYNALAGLSEGNRLVGIISHVADLKEKIDKQIIVTKDKVGGSSAKIVV